MRPPEEPDACVSGKVLLSHQPPSAAKGCYRAGGKLIGWRKKLTSGAEARTTLNDVAARLEVVPFPKPGVKSKFFCGLLEGLRKRNYGDPLAVAFFTIGNASAETLGNIFGRQVAMVAEEFFLDAPPCIPIFE